MFNTEAWQEAQTMAQQLRMEEPQAAAPQEQQQGLAEGGEDDTNSPVGVPVDIVEGIAANDDGNGTEETDPTVSDDYWGSAYPDWSYTDTDDDTDFGEESDERSPDVVGEEEDASETQSEFTDAEYQEVLDDLDNGNIEDVREFLEGLGLSDDDTEEAQDAPGVPEEDGSKLVDEGISIEDIVGGEEKVEGGLDESNNTTEEYTYDEDAYEDAEDALEDLQDALQDGDEEDLAEALEELQGYLGGFGKSAEEDQDGTEETQDGQHAISPDDLPGYDDDSDGDGVINLEDSDWDIFDRDGDGIEDYLVLDADGDGIVDVKEDSDGDGIVDVQDVDADNDGTDDWLVSDLDGDGIEYGKEDDDGDGIENAKDDSDGDGMLDWQDSDSDGNGIDDWEELFSDPYEFDCF